MGRGRSPDEAKRKGIGIRAHGAKKAFQALASPLVLLEIMSHLADPRDPDLLDCLASLVTLWHHCQTDAGGRAQLAFIEDAETQLAVAAYGAAPIQNYRFNQRAFSYAERIAGDPTPQCLQGLGPALVQLATQMSALESQFVDDLTNWVVRAFVPDAVGWDAFLKDRQRQSKVLAYLDSPASFEALVRACLWKARGIVEWSGVDPDENERLQTIREVLHAPLHLYRAVVRRIVASGCDMSKPENRNSLWDLNIAYAIGNYTVRGGQTVTFVTDDGMIAGAARAACLSAKVWSFDQFSASLR